MKNEILNLTYASSLTDLCEINTSFDSGVLRIAYHGENRNGSSISKEAFMKSIKTVYNCPVVCNYDRENDSLGGHDMEVVRSDDGSLNLINLTQPVGVVPQSAKIFWEEVEEDDGAVHEYLCVEVLIWKRQEAYKKLKEDGITAQSMEIRVKSGEEIDGVYVINDFEFTAFALIGVDPCFESASLAFSKQNFKNEFSEMMLELKDIYKDVNSLESKDDYKHTQKYSMEGGTEVLNKQDLITKYNVDVDALDFSIEDFTVEELEEKFKAMSQFTLTEDVVAEIIHALESVETIKKDWGEYPRYIYVDCDLESMEVYCWDREDGLLYGFTYKQNGDCVEIDSDSKKRKKHAVVDFDEGEQVSPIVEVFAQMEKIIKETTEASAEFEAKYNAASAKLVSVEDELKELREFKSTTETEQIIKERTCNLENIFANFEDLNGNEVFEAFKEECIEDCMKYELDDIEEKCFAIRGRYASTAKFNLDSKNPKLHIDPLSNSKADQPYGGIFEEYGFDRK